MAASRIRAIESPASKRSGGMMRKLVILLAACSVSVALAQTPAPSAQLPPSAPPKRAVDGPGAPPFTKIPSGNAPSNQEGNFVIGPDYAAPPELTVAEGVPVGKIT